MKISGFAAIRCANVQSRIRAVNLYPSAIEPYVETGFIVSEQLSRLAVNAETTVLAVDGDVTTDVDIQLRKISLTATHLFTSCGVTMQ